MEKSKSHGEMENVSRLFMTTNDDIRTPAHELPATGLNQVQRSESHNRPDVEEAVMCHRKISFSDTHDAQEKIRRCLHKYLRNDFDITRIELKKCSDTIEQGIEQRQEETVTFVLKRSSA